MILPVIMAGGTGCRLWPLSRHQFPKQFLKLFGEQSMLQATVNRLAPLDTLPQVVICNEVHRFSVAEQLRLGGHSKGKIILEPVGRSTAPAIAVAALQTISEGIDPLLLVLTTDQLIQDEKTFRAAVQEGVRHAEKGALATFGIVPSSPESCYGYIRRGHSIDQAAYEVDAFVEKPPLEVAEEYVESGEYYWNSGMFLFRASTYLSELKQHRPEIYSACERALANTTTDLDFLRLNQAAFEQCASESIDVAVMEKTNNAIVVPMDCGWSDIGNWSALWQVSPKDEFGNAFSGDVLSIDTKNTYVYSEDKLIATVGIEDLAIIDTKDALLVTHQSHVQKVKAIVADLVAKNRDEYKHHREVYRPWGQYDLIDCGEGFQVKRITLKPGARLSVQIHQHRAEHWVVVSGNAKVTIDGEESILTANQSTYIPVGAIHALENPGNEALEIIEIQSGSYLGEDDIIRLEDSYGRVTKPR